MLSCSAYREMVIVAPARKPHTVLLIFCEIVSQCVRDVCVCVCQ